MKKTATKDELSKIFCTEFYDSMCLNYKYFNTKGEQQRFCEKLKKQGIAYNLLNL